MKLTKGIVFWLIVVNIINVVALFFIVYAARAQYDNRTFYDANGHVIARSTTSSSGQTTYYGPNANVIGRSQPLSDGTIVIYNDHGIRSGTITGQKRK